MRDPHFLQNIQKGIEAAGTSLDLDRDALAPSDVSFDEAQRGKAS